MASYSSHRPKREDCRRTKHDSVFSKWEILIGSSDWEDHTLGKDGVQRYRIHNLPNGSSCPGLYELGVTAIPSEVGHKSRKYESENIVVVYLGQADNVRTRLQQYGRVGGHLDRALDQNERPGLFKEIFSKGYSIMFRWAPMLDKKRAEKMEAELLGVFDYAWNKTGNGACRRDEILSKLDCKSTSPVHIVLRKLQRWKHSSFGKKAGIKIDSSVPIDDQKSLLPQIIKFGKFQLQFVLGNNSLYEEHEICGVALGDGSVCRDMPLFGRKRCEKHKGKKILGTSSIGSNGAIVKQENTTACGLVLEDGSICAELPAHGRKRCELHNGRRVAKAELDVKPHMGPLDLLEDPFFKCQPQSVEGATKKEEAYNICGAINCDGSVCRNIPIAGRKRCEAHKGQRVAGARLVATSREVSETTYLFQEGYSTCGVINYDGSVCRNTPISGRKRCDVHKGQRVTVTRLELPPSVEVWEAKEDTNICGVVRDGYVCKRKPVSGRKRCEEHKGLRITGMASMTSIGGSLSEKGDLSVCGVGLGDGSICRKLPVPGRKRCALHKGRRAA